MPGTCPAKHHRMRSLHTKSLLRFIVLFLSMPLINSVLFGIGTLVHTMDRTYISPEQFSDYQQSTILMLSFSALAVLVIELLFAYSKIESRTASVGYLAMVIILIALTFGQFSFRPLEHGLTCGSMLLVIPFRLMLTQAFPSLFERLST